MNVKTVQSIMWWVFAAYYFGFKYLAGLQTWNLSYAIQVFIILLLTALLPYYLTRLLGSRFEDTGRIVVFAATPTIIALLGYATFYFVFVRPNFPDVTVAQVLPRSLFPGISISVILLMPTLWNLMRQKRMAPSESE